MAVAGTLGNTREDTGRLDAEISQTQRGPTVADPRIVRSVHTTAVVTPQAVLLEFRAAGIGSRVLAKMIDLLIQLGLLIVVSILAGILSVAGPAGAVVFFVGLFLILFGYPATEAIFNGQTVGKRVLKIRAITLQGGPIRFRHAAIRSIIGLVEFLLPPGGLVALASALLTPRSQRVGDLAAGTVVIRDATDVTQPVFFSPAYGAENFSTTLDVSTVSHDQYALMREFLLRAPSLTAAARHQVATELAAGLCRTLDRSVPSDVHPESVVAAAVFAFQSRFGPARAGGLSGSVGGVGSPPSFAPPTAGTSAPGAPPPGISAPPGSSAPLPPPSDPPVRGLEPPGPPPAPRQ